MDYLIPRKVRLILSSMWVLGCGFFTIVFNSIWPGIGKGIDLSIFCRKGVFLYNQYVL